MATKSVYTAKDGTRHKVTSQAAAEGAAKKLASEPAPKGTRTPVRQSGGKVTQTGPTIDYGDGTGEPVTMDNFAEKPTGLDTQAGVDAQVTANQQKAAAMGVSLPGVSGAGAPIPSPVATPAAAPTPTQTRYQQGLAAATASGLPAPTDAGAARTAMANYAPPAPEDTSAVDAYISDDPAVNGLLSNITQLLNPQKQTSTLMQDYKSLYRQSGLDEINEELIDAETVINGTEDDIRNEIQTAGGFGTESQVQAMALARNKGLLKRYNQLVQMKTDATNQLNTLSALNAQDKQIAQERLNSQINNMFNLANFKQQALNNIKEQARWMATQVGFDGIYNSYKSDPKQLANLEKTLGVAPGGLQSLASQAATERARKAQMEALDIAAKQASIRASNLSSDKTQMEIDALSGAGTPDAGGVQQIDSLLNDGYLKGAVGPNAIARWSPLSALTGGKANFIGGVEQLRQNLTLDKLVSAKANGATFGALSDSEMKLLAASATKIGTWAQTDKNGNVVGYNTSEASFKKELDSINNFRKIDFIKKGGDPNQVGVQSLPDGSLWTTNSDGTYTKLN